jgi:hypothetical protein
VREQVYQKGDSLTAHVDENVWRMKPPPIACIIVMDEHLKAHKNPYENIGNWRLNDDRRKNIIKKGFIYKLFFFQTNRTGRGIL